MSESSFLPKSLQLSKSLKLLSNGFLSIWCLIAVFPLLWITLMSLKYPLDAFSANPLVVIFGPGTLSAGASINFFDLLDTCLLTCVATVFLYPFACFLSFFLPVFGAVISP